MTAGPDRDPQIDAIRGIIAACGKAGIPAVKSGSELYRHPTQRRRAGTGRRAQFGLPLGQDGSAGGQKAGTVSEDEIWSRIDYFLARVIPAAEAAGVPARLSSA